MQLCIGLFQSIIYDRGKLEITKYQTIKRGKICYIYRIKAHQWINWSEGILGEEIIMAMLHKSA